jgi:hypothetical protein
MGNKWDGSLFSWLELLVYITGLFVSAWAFRVCRKRGYLLVGIYFALAIFFFWVIPYINRSRQPTITFSQTQQQKISDAIDKIIQEGGGQPEPMEIRITFPLGPLVLVAGIWLLARREQRGAPTPSQTVPPPNLR